MFTGEVSHQIDAKNRIRIPSRFKAELGGEFAFVKGHDCVCIFPKEVIEAKLAKIKESIDEFNPVEVKAFREYARGIITDVKEDNQGRIVLDKMFIKHAKLKKDIVTIGMVDHLEIVDASSLDEQDEKSFEETMSLFSKKLKEKDSGLKNGI